MGALAPSVAAVRVAVRRALRAVPAGDTPLALVACSGGADSLALAAATGFVAPRIGWRAGLLTVDHRLQPGSAARAEAVAGWAREAGLAPVEVLAVSVAGRAGGPEAAARDARYEALAAAARQLGAAAVLLGHTRDDQAETVLLALARGAGPRGLAGMPARRDADGVAWLRPLLDLGRARTRDACRALGLTPWEDPHNTDPRYARARVRAIALPALVEALGERVVDNLARTARLLAVDTEALDRLAAAALSAARSAAGDRPVAGGPPAAGEPAGVRTGAVDGAVADVLAVPVLGGQPEAVRGRALHAWARRLGAPGAALSHRHVAALDALVTDWHGQGPVHLPGGLIVTRRGDHLHADRPGRRRTR